ncbi:glycosyltransferase family 4 protein [Halotia branconii]|uniref:Glycosyltransferase family 4 protein n=1 Tax=Halotia branconii CENA392 TaxID=1539056 RepID=A0AAJ6P7Z3_9CYAN|nr:glycosyltransferase family 4 protein [Halotia branconii]WGV24076.1 glycosyltransferase family 4 protein [Halotia branconii CENA392]
MKTPYIGILMESPIQYHAPLFQFMAKDSRFRLKVMYMSQRGVKPFYNPQLKMTLQWDIPVLEGYDYVFLDNNSPITDDGESFWTLMNLGVHKTIAQEKFDAVWVHGYAYATCWLALLACQATKTPLFLRGESEDFFPRSKWKTKVRNFGLSAFLKQIAAALYIGSYNREFYLNHHVPEERLFYVPYNVDNDWFNVQTPERLEFRKQIRAELGLDTNTVVFIMASKHRLDRYPMDVIQAFCQIPKELNAALLVLGDGVLRPELEAYAQAHADGRHIHFLGLIPQSKYPGYLGTGDILIHPSSETWGCAINEGISANLAVISSDQVLGWKDMVHPEINGLIYPFHNVEALAQCIISLAQQPERVQQMRQASRKLSEDMDFGVCADGVAAALERFGKANYN